MYGDRIVCRAPSLLCYIHPARPPARAPSRDPSLALAFGPSSLLTPSLPHSLRLVLPRVPCVLLVVYGTETGMVYGVGFSIAVTVLRNSRPNVAVLGRLPGSHLYRNIANYPEV